MRVGIGAHLLHAGADYRSAGVSRYAHQLLLHLPQVCPEHSYVAFHGHDAPPLAAVRSILSPLPTHHPLIRILWEQTGLPWQAARAHVDVLHGTVNTLPLVASAPRVITVHDLSFLRHPEHFPRAKATYLRAAVRHGVRRAAHVIAVSEHTRHDLIDLLRVPPDRISVVYSGVDGGFKPLPVGQVQSFRLARAGARPYILHVGTLQPRKNIDVLIRAYGTVRRRLGLPHRLVLVGAKGWMYESLFELVERTGLADHVYFAGYSPPDELPLWYNGADLFVYPSAYEGFGLPVLEAMACGAPTITIASSGLKELAGDACLTVEPGSEEALEIAITRVLEDKEARRSLAEAGLRRAGRFRWAETARNTAAVYELAVRNR